MVLCPRRYNLNSVLKVSLYETDPLLSKFDKFALQVRFYPRFAVRERKSCRAKSRLIVHSGFPVVRISGWNEGFVLQQSVTSARWKKSLIDGRTKGKTRVDVSGSRVRAERTVIRLRSHSPPGTIARPLKRPTRRPRWS